MPYEKVGKNEPVCIADEVPFDIPDSWEWVRLSHIFSILNGDRGKNYPAKSTLSSTGIPFISAINLDGRTVVADDRLLCMTEAQYDKLGNGKLKKGDVVVCIRGSLGKHGRYPFDKGAIASSLVILRCHSCEEILAEYIMLWLDSPLFSSEIKKYDNGTAQPNLAAKSLEQFFVPLPPLNEQHRIIQQIDNLQPYLAEYNDAVTKITKLNETFPETLKKSILQWAVQGKLVPQDPSDEPAEILLERIRMEKQRLVKEGKIKKDKHESVIFRRDNSHYEKRGLEEVCIDEKIPFETPESWNWVRLGNIIQYQNGYAYKSSDMNKSKRGYPVIKSGNLMSLEVVLKPNNDYVENPNEKMLESVILKGDMLMCLSSQSDNPEPLGKTAIYKIDTPALLNQRVLKLRPICEKTTQYLYYVINSEYFHYTVSHYGGGSAQANLKLEHVLNMLIPIPPLEEQMRIISQIERLLSKVSTL